MELSLCRAECFECCGCESDGKRELHELTFITRFDGTSINCNRNLHSNGNPSGGSFSWSANGNTINLTPGGPSASYSSANQSSAVGDTSITVTYQLNGKTASAQSAPITVHKPTTLQGGSVALTGTVPCTLPCLTNPGGGSCNVTAGTSCSYNANQFQREYKVHDQFGTFFQDPSVGINLCHGY